MLYILKYFCVEILCEYFSGAYDSDFRTSTYDAVLFKIKVLCIRIL
jgi:hypothetical protein